MNSRHRQQEQLGWLYLGCEGDSTPSSSTLCSSAPSDVARREQNVPIYRRDLLKDQQQGITSEVHRQRQQSARSREQGAERTARRGQAGLVARRPAPFVESLEYKQPGIT